MIPIEAQSGNADQRRQTKTTQKIWPPTESAESDTGRADSATPQQVERQGAPRHQLSYRHQVEAEVDEVVAGLVRVEPYPVAGQTRENRIGKFQNCDDRADTECHGKHDPDLDAHGPPVGFEELAVRGVHRCNGSAFRGARLDPSGS